ncbi:hypothetical protein MMC29_001297 [Sticta canariensis]|nr:hypothetical protein [Sticta canariensis]
MAEPNAGILVYEHEPFRPREAEALHLLKTVGCLVKPILKQRGWKVDILCEFFVPRSQYLGLNLGRGQRVFLCLRDFDKEQEFRPLDELVDTMLHELAHMVHDGHANNFRILYKQLLEDFKGLTVADYKGDKPPPRPS